MSTVVSEQAVPAVATEVESGAQVVSVVEAARILDVHPRTISRNLKNGKLRGIRVGRYWKISRVVLQQMLS